MALLIDTAVEYTTGLTRLWAKVSAESCFHYWLRNWERLIMSRNSIDCLHSKPSLNYIEGGTMLTLWWRGKKIFPQSLLGSNMMLKTTPSYRTQVKAYCTVKNYRQKNKTSSSVSVWGGLFYTTFILHLFLLAKSLNLNGLCCQNTIGYWRLSCIMLHFTVYMYF